ncbi:MAG TPA: lysoplasmalogenase [Rhizobiaceae bacterium]|nr:lysoplasmalogenase [Rhizobiaceae bacterium]
MMPFPGGIESTSNATLLISVAAAVLYALVLNTRPTWVRTIVKTIPVTLLAVLTVLENGPLLLFAALALSAAGDAFLSRENERTFLYGLGSFLLAHLAYIALFYLNGGGYELLLTELWRSGAAIVLALFALAMLVLLLRVVSPDLRLPIFVYILAIAAMGVVAFTTSNVWIISGALLFIASDAFLATEKFLMPAISRQRDWMRFAVWGLYVAAQVAITLGFVLQRAH